MITEIITILFVAILAYCLYKNKVLADALKKTEHDLKSSQVKFGKSFEHFVPFINNFPGNREKTVFLGMPIDFICFDEDYIKFIECKTGESQLSPKQKFIKKQIEKGKIKFLEMRYG